MATDPPHSSLLRHPDFVLSMALCIWLITLRRKRGLPRSRERSRKMLLDAPGVSWHPAILENI